MGMPIPHLSRRVATLVLQNSLAIALGAIDLDAQARDSLTVRVARAIEGEGLVGATWSLVTPTGVTVGAAGLRDLARRTPMHPHDRVHVGSIAKTFVATGVLRLVTEGRIDLDAPVAQYLPDLPIENAWAETAPLRVRHLLDHTSGLGDARMWQVFTLRGDPDAPLRAGLARPGERLRLRYRPGARFTYSNPGYLIAAMLIEQVTGTRYEEWLERELLLPLGMSRSTFAFVSQVGRAADTTLAMGHFDGVTSHPAYAIPVRAATQFTTTAADMAIFARFLMSDGQVDGRRLVDSTLLRAMAVPTTTEAVQAGLGTGYGLGLVHRERWGITGKCHLGNLGTFRALLCMYPEHQRALFVSINTDPEGANFDRVDSLLAAALDVPPTPVAPAAAPGVDVAAWEGWYVVRPNRFAQFAYLDALGGVTRIDRDGDALNLRPLQGTARVLRPVGGALFRIDERRAATHVLTLSSDGVPVVTDGLRTLERVPRWRVALSWLSAAAGVVALLYLLLVGPVRTVRAWRAKALRTEALRWTTVVLVPLALAPLLFLTQPFLAIGDPTPPSLMLAIASGALPVALVLALVDRARGGPRTRAAILDTLALAGALQWCVVLAAWGLLPLMLWR